VVDFLRIGGRLCGDRIGHFSASVLGLEVVEPDVAGPVDLDGDDERLGGLGDFDNPFVPRPIVRDRWIASVLRADVGEPVMRPLAFAVEELSVEDGFRRLLGLDEGADLEARDGAGALDALRPLRDWEVALFRLLEMQAGAAAVGDGPIPLIFNGPRKS
jgi:hypothetical protein